VPIYTCTTNDSTLSAQTKKALAGEIATIHSEINHLPSTYVNVVSTNCPPTTSTPTAYRPIRCSSAVGYVRATQRPRSRALPPKSPPPWSG
jgi:phenylpyruvate tautomerase PptA (4-oxalocrotonate tautomerase family)